jgi:hypothetical protein
MKGIPTAVLITLTRLGLSSGSMDDRPSNHELGPACASDTEKTINECSEAAKRM